MAAGTSMGNTDVRSDRPLAVTVFVSCLAAFVLAATVSYYPRELFPGALWALPLLSLFFGALALGIWNRSAGAWVINVWMWASLLWRSVSEMATEPTGPFAAHDYDQVLLRAVMAAVLLNILLSPSLFRWMWRRQPVAN